MGQTCMKNPIWSDYCLVHFCGKWLSRSCHRSIYLSGYVSKNYDRNGFRKLKIITFREKSWGRSILIYYNFMKHLGKDGYLSEDEVSSKYPFVLIVTHKCKGMRQDEFLCFFSQNVSVKSFQTQQFRSHLDKKSLRYSILKFGKNLHKFFIFDTQ